MAAITRKQFYRCYKR